MLQGFLEEKHFHKEGRVSQDPPVWFELYLGFSSTHSLRSCTWGQTLFVIAVTFHGTWSHANCDTREIDFCPI